MIFMISVYISANCGLEQNTENGMPVVVHDR